jgi:hypothetical protein
MKAIKRGLFTSIAIPGVSLLALVGLVLSGPQAAWAKHHSDKSEDGPDPTAVTACGTLSGSDTIYYLTSDLTESTDSATCITLSGTGSALLLNGFNITGPGSGSTGDGIHITGTSDVIEGFNGTVQGFEIGIIDTGGGSVGDDFNVTDNVTGLELNSTATTRFVNFSSFSNSGNGVFINDCGEHCSVLDFSSNDNGANGVLIEGSTFPLADVFIATGNTDSGVQVGGTTSGEANTHAVIADAFTSSPVGVSDNTSYGIVITTSDSTANDFVTTIEADDNLIDLYDENSTCGHNLWFNNSFTSSKAGTVTSPACIGGIGS